MNTINLHKKTSNRELIWKLLLVWLGSVNLKNNEWLNMVDLCEFAEMIKYPFYDEVYMKRDRRNTVTHPVTLKFDIRIQSFIS